MVGAFRYVFLQGTDSCTGANDVAMIQEADVGVGIAGVEGRQAVMCSDYAIGQFRYLDRLILVHGRWSYRRLAEMTANFFYKVRSIDAASAQHPLTWSQNIVWTVALFWYQLYNDFDGSYLFEYTYLLMYNLAFTSVPVILMGILDQDVDDKVSLAVPQLYRRGILRQEWTQTKFWVYMADGIYQSVICFYMTYLVFYTGSFASPTGQDTNGREQMGVYVACSAVVVVNAYILINQYRWDWVFGLVIAISALLVYIWTAIYSAFEGTFYQTAGQIFGSLSFWCTSLLTIIICLLPRMTAKAIQKMYFPLDIDIIREQFRQGRFAYLYSDSPSTKPDSPQASTPELQTAKPAATKTYERDDELRPIYPPSVAPTATGKRASANGSDGTDGSGYQGTGGTFTPRRFSLERHRPSMDRARPSFDRIRTSIDRTRASMDRPRPSFEASNDFTSAALLARMESRNSGVQQHRSSLHFGPTDAHAR